ncbi:CAP domain-containing protein [Micromonospora sp. CPCC 206060]|uniref:CAP domain-containing protein n=1 Tax=Micromonospora sp. CPCC 206060 TaxID=3122406 RepID=UPI002FF320C5
MHGWNDPLDQEGAQRPVPPTGEPPHRSSGQPSPAYPDWDGYQSYGSAAYASLPGPVDPHRTGPSGGDDTLPSGLPHPGHPEAYHANPDGYRYEPDADRYPTDGYRYEPDADRYPTDGYRYESDGYPYVADGYHQQSDGYRHGADGYRHERTPSRDEVFHDDRVRGTTGWTGATSGAPVAHRTADARRRSGRRLPRPTLAAGAAAVVALAVMVGAGVAFLPTGNEGQQPLVAEGAGGLPVDGGSASTGAADTAGDPTGTPSATTSPNASPSPTAKPSPTPVRAKAPTRSIKRTASPAPSRTQAPAGNTGTSSVEQQVVTLVNQERAKAGCGAVTINANLATAAQLHSDDQAARQQMSHTGSDGSDFVQRAKRAGYQYPIGENVAMGYETAAAVMEGWMNSPGHRANILNCDAKAIGVGVATGGGRLYWTQVFGSRA